MFLSSGASLESSPYLPLVIILSGCSLPGSVVTLLLEFYFFILPTLIFPVKYNSVTSNCAWQSQCKGHSWGCFDACKGVSSDYYSVKESFPFQPLIAYWINYLFTCVIHVHAQVCVSVALRLWLPLEKDLCLILVSFLRVWFSDWNQGDLLAEVHCSLSYLVHTLSPRTRR